MMWENKRIGLVFSGGGARGAYQVGVWNALDELGITDSVVAVYGTSVGAINGAAFVQGDISLTEDIWKELSYQKVFANIPDAKPSFSARREYLTWIKKAIKNKGLDVNPLKEILRESLSEEAIRESKKHFGLVVFDLSNRKGKYLRQEDIDDGLLVEYVIASATFPTFQPHKIKDQLFIDGGVRDNRPLQFFTEEDDVDFVICVDVTAIRHVWKNKSTEGDHDVIFIRPSRLLGSPMSFVPERIQSNMKLGHDDAYRQIEDYFLEETKRNNTTSKT